MNQFQESASLHSHTEHLVCTVIEILFQFFSYSKTNEMHQFFQIYFILFCSSTRHVSDGLSVHHQESKTVHTPDAVCTVLDS